MKRIIIAFFSLLLAVGVALTVIFATFDANRYKPQLIELGRSLTGREFDIRGDIVLHKSLTPSLIVEDVILPNASWATHATMLAVSRFEAEIRLLALLSHRLEITRLVLVGANLVLERDDDGRGNWAFKPESSTASEGSPARLFDLQSVSVRDSRIELVNSATPTVVVATRMELLPADSGQRLRLSATLLHAERQFELGAEVAPLSRLFANEPYDFDLRLTVGEARLTASGVLAEPLAANGLDIMFDGSAPLEALFPPGQRTRIADNARAHGAGHVTGGGGIYAIDELLLTFGASKLQGSARVDLEKKRPYVSVEFDATDLDLRPFSAAHTKAARDNPRVFSTAPLALAPLDMLDFELTGTIGRLQTHRALFETLRIVAKLDAGELAISQLHGLLEKGEFSSTLTFAARDDIPSMTVSLKLGHTPFATLVSASAAKQIRRGQAAVAVKIKSHGVSIAELAAHATGSARLTLSDVELAERSAGVVTGDLLLRAFTLLNPLSSKDAGEAIECAVFNFPIKNGQAESATGIGIRTRNLNILGGGSIDLASERLDIGVNPKPRAGIGLNLAGLAEFVRVGGTLSNPTPTTNAVGAATAGIKIGAAIATGGLSLLAEGLLDRSGADVDVCAVAAGTATLPSRATQATSTLTKAADKTSSALQRAGDAVKGGFGRLFAD